MVAAGVAFYERPRPSVWWAFACAVHVDEMTAARGLLERDRVEIARRQRHRGHREADGAAVQPLARGGGPGELIARARAWADRHPEQLYPAAPPNRPRMQG